MTRHWTPDRVNADGSTTITSKRACNGCGKFLGDITDSEMQAAIHGAPLPDVRRECPDCGPTAPEPVCRPMPIVAGEPVCLDGSCDHDLPDGAEYCAEVREEFACATHSRSERRDGRHEITHAEPWPCTHTKAVTS